VPHVELIVVSDGEEALDFVARQGKYVSAPAIDLVILDLNLPKSDGGDVLRSIRENSRLAGVPVVVLTSSDSPRDRAAAERLGANSYITKPTDLDEFLALGSRLLSHAPAAGATAARSAC
jgi:DNA-binding response OmpR family regulator